MELNESAPMALAQAAADGSPFSTRLQNGSEIAIKTKSAHIN
jgi:hypothetical protein